MRPIGGELVTTITTPSCWGTHFLYLSNPPAGIPVPIIPWVVAAFNQEKALVEAFSVIVQLHRLIVYSTNDDSCSSLYPAESHAAVDTAAKYCFKTLHFTAHML